MPIDLCVVEFSVANVGNILIVLPTMLLNPRASRASFPISWDSILSLYTSRVIQ